MSQSRDETAEAEDRQGPAIEVLGRRIPMPRSRRLRILCGVLLMLGGTVGFLPVVGFWMIPAGLLVLSYDIAKVRRWRRRSALWWERRRRAGKP